MQNLKNNWIILDLLGNIYEIYANLTLMTLSNLNHFLLTQAELCENPGDKALLTLPVPIIQK